MVDILVDSEGKALTTGGKAIKATGSAAPIISSLNVTPTTSAQQITAPTGIDGYSPINVSAVTASIDANILPENIKSGITILGVTGTYEGSGGGGSEKTLIFNVTGRYDLINNITVNSVAHSLSEFVNNTLTLTFNSNTFIEWSINLDSFMYKANPNSGSFILTDDTNVNITMVRDD